MVRMSVAALVVLLVGCGAEPACEDGAYSCDGTLLLECVEGAEEVVEDCADEGLECHADHGHCHDHGAM